MTACPACNVPLRLVVEQDVELDVCDECHGVWLDPGELDALSDTSDFSSRGFNADQIAELNCPRCSTRTFKEAETAVGAFTRCSNCQGVFVSGDTLDCIAGSERRGLLSKKTAEAGIVSVDLIDLLWFFTHG